MARLSTAWAQLRPPWKEGLELHVARGVIGDGQPKVVFGRMAFRLREYEPEVGRFRAIGAADEALAAYADVRWALLQLQHWSRLYGVEWNVALGNLHGQVTPSGFDAGAARILDALCARAGRPDERRVEVLRAHLDRKYGDRP